MCVLLLLSFHARADHLVGGDITWTCLGGGQFQFELRVIMDCNGTIAASPMETIQVWNHSSVSSINVNASIDYDASPGCQPSAGSAEITCAAGGSGAYTIFKYVSNPVTLGGVPPAAGWIFTWDGFSRSPNLDNLDSPQTYGMTIVSKMFNNSGANASPCYDSSPHVPDSLGVLFCTGAGNFHVLASDPDADSLVYSFGSPLTFMTATQPIYSAPPAVPHSAGYSSGSPLPGNTHNPSNVAASLNTEKGEISFTSFTQGVFSTVLRVESYRCGVKIAENNFEYPITVLPCSFGNNDPVIAAPLVNGAGMPVFYDTVYAGQLVSFDIQSTDVEFLQDGATPQQNTLTAFGAQFGNNFTDPALGCTDPPCAVMSSPLPASGSQGVLATFSWQTDCAHVKNPTCQDHTTHNFHFSVHDDVCPVPGAAHATVSITVINQPLLDSPEPKCADVQPDGSVQVTWEPIADPTGSFVEYRIYASTGGPYVLQGVEPNIAIGTFLDAGADAQNGSVDYIVRTVSGCTPGEAPPEDTLSTIYLSVLNPGDGTAVLTWNNLIDPLPTSAGAYYYIAIEYPLGTWTLADSVPVTSNNLWVDTITVCNDSITYLVYTNDSIPCISQSSFDGGIFQDKIPPHAPTIQCVTVDTNTNQAIITWDENPQLDTYGYIIFEQDVFGNWVILDTVYGYSNTTYFHLGSDAGSMSETYGVAAFDSCLSGSPLAPNTSVIGVEHNTIYLTGELDICAKSIELNWNDYINWGSGVQTYELYVSENGSVPVLLASLGSGVLAYTHENLSALSTYCYVIRAVAGDGKTSLSNKRCITVVQPSIPSYLYTRAASVENPNQVQVRVHLDPTATINALELERAEDPSGPWDFAGSIVPVGGFEIFNDADVDASVQPYYYKVTAIDSCMRPAVVSQISKTIHLTVAADQTRLVNLLQWTDYEGYDGAVLGYNVYRSVNGVFDPTPIGTVGIGPRFYEDNVESFVGTNADGEFCYYVEAIENTNSYGISERAKSNVACAVEKPLLFVPNAFILGGHNNEFKPVGSYIDLTEYEMNIYNRWSKQVFQTNDIHQAWDGHYNGERCREDVYVYIITFRDGAGALHVQKGHVTLLHAQ